MRKVIELITFFFLISVMNLPYAKIGGTNGIFFMDNKACNIDDYNLVGLCNLLICLKDV